jgi:hypothetical protein
MRSAPCSRGRRQIAWSLILLMLAAVVLAAQDQPDFSGRWVLAGPEQPGPDIPRAFSVRQSLVRTNVRGEPMKPFFKDIVVAREFEIGIRSETYLIDVLSGFVSGLTERGDPNGPNGHSRVTWDRNALVFENGRHTGDMPETGVWDERRETWSLETGGRLRVTITTRSSSDVSRTVTLIYRRSDDDTPQK